MNFPYRLLLLCSLVGAVGLTSTPLNSSSAHAAPSCPTPALSRFQRHQVNRGETLESIAQRYNLTPTTLMDMNPAVKNGNVTVGSELQIPPYNGFVVQVASGQTWREVAKKYEVRADTLFEINGCQQDPRIVFVPVGNVSPSSLLTASGAPADSQPISISGYPLQSVATVALPYGWQIHPTTAEVFFHSGVDFIAPVGSSVQAIAPGTIVFAEQQGTYGQLVIVNHSGGLQSRYAHLGDIQVSVGQKVNAGDLLGTVGTTGEPTGNQPHLHFEMRSSSDLGWVAEDPQGYLQQSGF
ncbi:MULTISPECIES: LysM peptidoglycan-binding domain-containing M23 family metallopeptidase [Cyanophyceae]|jgi:murein DD-endopeptidase MepM/ murein hydrolase activator NlpD|uniref:LysM peptidoglycan-binding domain-containing M23 family metallopeptidase n=1 Tax=Cyanophyceae TaxID=3028117 RepID=UPI00232E459C|nr:MULTISPECIES: M23 family metallopeptidase [Cyanophyceae]MDB9306343.1 M23 family metallopeptidase [Nodularia spumigena CS-591/12]MDB9399891.1 M23 family metallopeptidase [Microcystis aeruginosa CS-567/02-A1]MDB9499474.1 M23 family metallopeptidase [Nodularia spumigena CS-336/02]MDB9533771.1 M23 family metallopeptidase [Nodularia spumigena CS-1038]